MIYILLLVIGLIILFISYEQGALIETFRSKNLFPTRSRSVELYNPSTYSGMFIRKFDTPLAYTRTNLTYPAHNSVSITKSYLTKGNKYDMTIKNLITPMWNVPDVYPLQSRRMYLM